MLLMIMPPWASLTQNYGFATLLFESLHWDEDGGAVKQFQMFFKGKS